MMLFQRKVPSPQQALNSRIEILLSMHRAPGWHLNVDVELYSHACRSAHTHKQRHQIHTLPLKHFSLLTRM